MDVGLIRQDLDKVHSRMTEAENRVGQVEDAVENNTGAIRSQQSRVKMLEHHAEDSENRCHRNNIQIVELAEGVEGKNPTVFAEELLRSLLPAADLPPYFTVERAYRLPPQLGPQGSPLHTFTMRLLNFRNRDELLRAARAAGELTYRKNRLMLFLDFSIESQKLQRSFNAVSGPPH